MLRVFTKLLATLTCVVAIPVHLSAVSAIPDTRDFNAAQEHIFLPDEVTEVYITLDPQDLQDILDDPFSDDLKVGTVRWKNSVIDEVIEDVGIRLRGGNFTRPATRKSWKLDINDFAIGRDFYGLESINLNGDHNDPTLLRRAMAHELLWRMGLPTSRTHYAAIFINDELISINLHTEHVDDEFVDNWFGNKNGNLYKCVFKGAPADLVFIESEEYWNVGGGLTYEEKRNFPDTDYTDLQDFIRFINFASSQEMLEELETYISIDNFLRYLAANIALGSWDDYWYGSNNYYIYWNLDTERFEWIAYDYDQVLGMDYFGIDWSQRHFTNWGEGGFGTSPAPLVDAVFSQSEWRRQFRRYLYEAVDILRDEDYRALLERNHNLIRPWFDGTIATGGTTGTSDTGGRHDQYFYNYNEPATYQNQGFHTMGLIPFLDQRADTLEQQLDSFFDIPPLPTVRINEIMASNSDTIADNTGGYEDWIELYNFGEEPIDLSGWYLTDDPNDPMMFEIPEGITIDAGEFLVIWASGAPERTEPGYLHTNFRLARAGEAVALHHNMENGRILVDWFQFPELLVDQGYGRYPDATGDLREFDFPTPGGPNNPDSFGGGQDPPPPPRLFVNEFMATNNTTIANQFGEYNDWIEIYNDEDHVVDMSGMFLTDDLNHPTMWEFPAGTVIEPKGFLLVWADNQPEASGNGELHADFALSRDGEEIGLFDTIDHAVQPIHTFAFGPQETDVSKGLLPDGVGEPQILSRPTPGFSNVLPDLTDHWMIHAD